MISTKRKVMAFANGLRKLGWEQGRAVKEAWYFIKHNPSLPFLRFRKTSGEVTCRVVDVWIKHNELKGTGKALAPERKIFTDMAKVFAGQSNNTISTYEDNILEYGA